MQTREEARETSYANFDLLYQTRPNAQYEHFLGICQEIINQARDVRRDEFNELARQRQWLAKRRKEIKAILRSQGLLEGSNSSGVLS